MGNSLIRKITKRYIAAVIPVALVLGMMPQTAYAYTTDEVTLESITIRPIKGDVIVSNGIELGFDIVPKELEDKVTVYVSSDNTSVADINHDYNSLWGYRPGTATIIARAEYQPDEGDKQVVESEPVEVSVLYPKGRIFEYEGGKRYSEDGKTLYEGWLSKAGSRYYTEKKDGNYEVYYFDLAKPDSTLPSAITGVRNIGGFDYKFDSEGKLIKEWIKLESVRINPIPAEANQTGVVAENTLSIGSSVTVSAELNPKLTNDSFDPEWTVSDSSAVEVVNAGFKDNEIYATLTVLQVPENPTNPVNIKVTVGDEATDGISEGFDAGYNRITTDDDNDLDLYVTLPVGWQKGEDGGTYYGRISEVEAGGRKTVELVKGWWPEDFDNRNTVNKEYYFDETTGAMVTGVCEIEVDISGNKERRLFDFGSDGVLRGEYNKNGFVEYPEGMAFFDAEGSRVYDEVVTDESGERYYINADGYLQYGWFATDESGTRKLYYRNEKGLTLKGWQTLPIEGTDPVQKGKFYFNTDGCGEAATGVCEISGKTYLFDNKGVMQKGLAEYAGDTYYLNSSGVMQYGWQKINGEYFYFDAESGRKTDAEYTDEANGWLMFDKDGKAAFSYIRKGKPVKGWLTLKRDGRNYKYYFDTNAELCTGVTAVGNKRYYLKDYSDSNSGQKDPINNPEYASLQYGVIESENPSSTYFANSSGVLQAGWRYVKEGGKYSPEYYSTEDATYGQKQVVKAWKDSDGIDAVETGWYEITGPTDAAGIYYIAGGRTLKKGNTKIRIIADADHKKDYTFCLDPVTGKYNGTPGSVIMGSKSYYNRTISEEPYASAEGYPNVAIILSGEFADEDGKVYYVDAKGNLVRGWIRLKNSDKKNIWRYFRLSDGAELDETGIDDDNKMVKRPDEAVKDYWGVITEDGVTSAYYFKNYSTMCKKVWQTINGDMYGNTGKKKYYFEKDGKLVRPSDGIAVIGGKRYGFDPADGSLRVNYYGGLTDDEITNGIKYCCNKNGLIMTGWQKVIDESDTLRWHYFNPYTGIENKGHYSDDGSGNWYIIMVDGRGLKKERAKFYFGKRGPVKGWLTLKNDGSTYKYYFDATGRLATGVTTIKNTVYYFDERVTDHAPHYEGMLMTNDVYNVGGSYFYTTSSGAAKKGWFTDKGGKYYADPATGKLAVGFKMIGDKVYFFSDSDATIGQLLTGFFKLSYKGQTYYDKKEGASNLYYADANGVICAPEEGWKNIKINPKVSDSQEWSYYLNPARPGIDMGDFTLAGEITTGDVLIDDDGSVKWLDAGMGASDGFAVVDGKTVASDIAKYYRFDPITGARRKTVLYFYGNYYGITPIDSNQVRTIATMRRFVNTDMKFANESGDFIVVNGGSDFPMAASGSASDEKASYEAQTGNGRDNDLNDDGHIDVLDTEIYSKTVYDSYIDKYGPNNLCLMGSSSGAGICLGLYDYAISKGDPNYLPADVLLLSPWVDVSMGNVDCEKLTKRQTGPTDVGTLRYWGARYTRDKWYSEGNVRPYKNYSGEGVSYPFASPIKSENIGKMENVVMYCGSYDPCIYDCRLFVEKARNRGNNSIVFNSYSGQQHGFMFYAANSNAVKVTVDACRRVMTE